MSVERPLISAHSGIAMATLWVIFVGMDGAAQILLKNAATHVPSPSFSLEWIYATAMSIRVWAALACLAVVFGAWMMILRRSPLASAFPMTASTYVVVVTASQLVYGEGLAYVQYLGIALIIAGVLLLHPGR